MTETIVFENTYMCYIENAPYEYPSIDVDHTTQGANMKNDLLISTGWHVIPNFLWRHCCIPRQWDALVRGCEAYKVKSIHGTIFNPIPITTNLSLQRVSLFSAFNNCTYALTYTDDLYETDWQPWLSLNKEDQLHLSQREGIIWKGTQIINSDGASGPGTNYVPKRYSWPIYQWRKPNMRTIFDNVWSQGKQGQAGVHDVFIGGAETDAITQGKLVSPSGVFWDPFNRPESIGELRAGKNSITFDWQVHPTDEDKFFNLDVLAAYTMWSADGPYCGVGRPGTLKDTTAHDPQIAATYGLAQKIASDHNGPGTQTIASYNDYTIPNYANQPIMPTKWFWKEMQQSVAEWLPGMQESTGDNVPWWWKINKHWPGTEKEAAMYPPCQWFCKGIPLYDVQSSHIRTSTQISFKIKLVLEGKKRRSAYYCPTYGPISGQQLYYQSNERAIYQPACIRYRTGGMRRTWQNLCAEWKYTNTQGNQNMVQNEKNIKAHPRIDSFLFKMDTTNTTMKEQCRYNQGHNITGMKDHSGANTPGNIVGRKESQPLIRVRWTRDTDTSEILMDDED
nr:capsid protein VP1 [Chaphamaparvovirus anseriform 9]